MVVPGGATIVGRDVTNGFPEADTFHQPLVQQTHPPAPIIWCLCRVWAYVSQLQYYMLKAIMYRFNYRILKQSCTGLIIEYNMQYLHLPTVTVYYV